jgi:predicted O-methyltransferase YrrM
MPLALDFTTGSTTPEELALIQRLVGDTEHLAGPIIEIGSLLGATTVRMAAASPGPRKIIAVDAYCWNPWNFTPDTHFDLARLVMAQGILAGKIELVRADKAEFYRTYRGPAPSLVFLDAIHTYEETKLDVEWALRAGAQVISGHDYGNQWPGVQKVVEEFGGRARQAGSVWVLDNERARKAA